MDNKKHIFKLHLNSQCLSLTDIHVTTLQLLKGHRYGATSGVFFTRISCGSCLGVQVGEADKPIIILIGFMYGILKYCICISLYIYIPC